MNAGTQTMPTAGRLPGQRAGWRVSGRVVLLAGRAEAARLCRNPLVLGGLVIAAALIGWNSRNAVPQWGVWDVQIGSSLLAVAGPVLVAAHFAAGRVRRDGAGPLYDSYPASSRARATAHLLGLAGPLALAAVLESAAIIWLDGLGAVGTPRLDVLAQGLLVVVLGGAAGVALGSFLPNPATAILAVIVLGAAEADLLVPFSGPVQLPGGTAWLFPWTQPVVLRWLPGPTPMIPPSAHLAWLAALTALAAIAALWRAAPRMRLTRLTGLTALATAGCLALAGWSGWTQTRQAPASVQESLANLITHPAQAERCITQRRVRYCAYPGFGPDVARWAAAVNGVLARLPAPPATPPVVRQVVDADIYTPPLIVGYQPTGPSQYSLAPPPGRPGKPVRQRAGFRPSPGSRIQHAAGICRHQLGIRQRGRTLPAGPGHAGRLVGGRAADHLAAERLVSQRPERPQPGADLLPARRPGAGGDRAVAGRLGDTCHAGRLPGRAGPRRSQQGRRCLDLQLYRRARLRGRRVPAGGAVHRPGRGPRQGDAAAPGPAGRGGARCPMAGLAEPAGYRRPARHRPRHAVAGRAAAAQADDKRRAASRPGMPVMSRWMRHRARSAKLGFAAATPHLARTMPWGALLGGCAAGLAVSLAAYQFAHPFQAPTSITLTVRAGFVPLVAAIGFLASDPHRNLTAALPAPAWLTTATHLVIALPALSLTTWIQLELAAAELRIALRPQGTTAHLPWWSLTAELAAWSAIALAAAGLAGRTRWHDLDGAIAVPATLAFIALLAATPLHMFPSAFTGLTPSQHSAWVEAEWRWPVVGVLAALIACWAHRDPWLRLGSGRYRRTGYARPARAHRRRSPAEPRRPARCR